MRQRCDESSQAKCVQVYTAGKGKGTVVYIQLQDQY